MELAQVAPVAAGLVTLTAAVAGLVRWMLGRERERADALYQTREACAARDATVRHEFGSLLMEVRDEVKEMSGKVDLLVAGRVKS